MSRFRKLTHTVWHCQYHIVWVPKYRDRVLTGPVGKEATECIGAVTSQAGGEVVELNVQRDHVHLVALIPPKVSVSTCVGRVKGRSAIRLLRRFPHIRVKRYWGNHFWARGYAVDTIGFDAEMIRRYVKYQENKERKEEQLRLNFGQ